MLKRFDCLRRVPRDISQGCLSGAVVSIITLILMTAIFYSQISMWLTPEYKRRTTVKRSAYDDYIPVNIKMTFLAASCDKLNFKIHDSFAVETRDHTKHLNKIQRGQSCAVHADFYVRKINGEFFFISTDDKTDLSHSFEEILFGDDLPYADTHAFKALSGVKLRNIGASTHDYILKLLQTEFYNNPVGHHGYSGGSGRAVTYQYTFSHRPHHKPKEDKPKDGKPKDDKPKGEKTERKTEEKAPESHFIRFKYNWSPLSSEYQAEYSSLYYVLTNSVAYCGALFTTAGVLHRAYLGGSSLIKKTIAKKL